MVCGGFTLWWLIRTAAYINTPIGPYHEYYPHNWGFQPIVGALYCGALLAVTAGVIAIERWLLGLFGAPESDRASKFDRVIASRLDTR
jgi:hypothetical protein